MYCECFQKVLLQLMLLAVSDISGQEPMLSDISGQKSIYWAGTYVTGHFWAGTYVTVCKFPNNYSSFNVVVLQAPDSKGINMMRVHTINLASGQGSFPDALHVDSTCFSTSFLLTLG